MAGGAHWGQDGGMAGMGRKKEKPLLLKEGRWEMPLICSLYASYTYLL